MNQFKKFDKGPWKVEKVGPNYADIYSSDFEHDVRISVGGDFEDMQQLLQYAEDLAETLNAAIDLTRVHDGQES